MNISGIKNKLKKNKFARVAKNYIFLSPYAKYYEKCRIEDNVILYESFYGKGMTCGPKAIFNELLADKKYIHVWVYDNKEEWRDNFEKYDLKGNVKFVKIKSREYYRYLASAKYLINNSTFPACFTRKEGQIYINTWHGIPLKHMGYDMPNGNISVANTERNFLQASYLLSPDAHHTNMYTKAYKLDGIFEGKIIETGQARTDTIFNSKRSDVTESLRQKGINVEKDKKIVLYAPTWKGENFNEPKADIEQFENVCLKVNEIAGESVQLLIKPHQAVYNQLKNNTGILKGKIISPTFDTNELLSAVDVLVSDYSSIFFDFLVTDRPIMFYIPDLQDYNRERGMYMDIDKLPGPATDDVEKLCEWLKEPEISVAAKRANYKNIKEEFCKYDDGNVAKRIVKAIFEGDFSQVNIISTKTEKKKIFISLGRALQNGITHSFLSLLNNIDYDRYDVTAYFYEAVAPDQVIRINEVNENVRVLVRTNYIFAKKTELIRLIIGMAFNAKGIFGRILPEKYFKRQAKRMVGNAEFDSVVEFCGYSPIMAWVLPEIKSKTKAIWQHNDLIADQNRKVNHKKPLKKKMALIFNTYPRWDRLVSCSHSVMEVNYKNLCKPNIKDKFSYAKNTINFQRVYDCLEEGCQYEGFEEPNPEEINFVTMGRLSPEKNHKNLVRAFGEYLKEYPKSKLYIIGQGPLQEEVEGEIERLGIKDRVVLTGNLLNPFTLMSKCSCFILPSVYEGQPMVLLEARIVGLPIVVSDFSSVEDSLMENGQYLIKSTQEAILEGLRAFAKGEVPTCKFDPRQYNKEAINEFEQAISK